MSLFTLQVTSSDITALQQGILFTTTSATDVNNQVSAINATGATETVASYADQLLADGLSTSQVAMGVTGLMTGQAQTVAVLTNLVMNPAIIPSFQSFALANELDVTQVVGEDIGLAFAANPNFVGNFGGQSLTAFSLQMLALTGINQAFTTSQVQFFIDLYQTFGLPENATPTAAQIQAAAYGVVFGLDVALNLEGTGGTQATTNQTLVKNALFDIAQSGESPPGQMYVPGATLAAQPVPTPFQSGPAPPPPPPNQPPPPFPPPPVTWVSEGPSPGINGQQGPSGDYNLGGLNTDGAIQAIAVNPTNPNIMYVATVNGGIWETTNDTAPTPHWVRLTDSLPSLSMGALAFDPTDATDQTLIAGIGATSSFGAIHNTLSGVLRTTDGGKTWSQLGTTALAGDNITSVAARGTTLLAAADSIAFPNNPANGLGLFRSTDTGTTWTNISDGKHGLPINAPVSDLVGDPLHSNVFYAGVTGAAGGVFKSTDGGLDWTKITGIGIINNTTDKILLAVHDNGTHVAVFATVDNQETLKGVFQSLDGASFEALDVPKVPSGGNGGSLFGSISADPTNPNIVYVGYGEGDTGTNGYLTRIDASKAPGSQITPLNGGSFGSPHSDLRDMQIDANGNLILSSDGGLYSLPTPTVNTGTWKAIGGDIGAFELHDVAYDHISHVIVAGSQDNGTLAQQTPGDTTWNTIEAADGGDVAIDDRSMADQNESIRYVSAQNLQGFQRQVYNSANDLVGTPTLLSPSSTTSPIPDAQFVTPLAVNNVDPELILVGGSKNIYMSSDQGTLGSLTAIYNAGVNSGTVSSASSSASGATMVYGGYQNGIGNPDLIYAASGANVLTKTTAAGGFTPTAPGGGTIVGVTDNPNNWATVFAIDNKQVFESTNAGGTWVPITNNLTSISKGATVYSIAYVPDAGNDALVVGTSSGVFDAHVLGLLGGIVSAWSQFGANLPSVIVSELQYDAQDNVLVAATMGRGAWLVNNVTEALGLAVPFVGIADHVISQMV